MPQLEAFGAIVDEADASGLDGEALDAFCDQRVRAHFDALLAARGLDDPEVRRAMELDVELDAQGLAFAVKKRRFKRDA